MGRGKRAGRWRAVVWPYYHIDDGSMGGGGTIPHDEYVTEAEQDEIIDNYFTPEREDIFFYCLFAHKEPDNDPDDPRSSTSSLGESGKPFTIFDANLDNANHQGKCFMHELGHNLGLDHPSDNDNQFDWNPFNDPTIDSAMYQGKHEVINYKNHEWGSITINPW